MRTIRYIVAGAVLAFSTLAGCGSEPETVEFKATDTSQFDQMKNQMMDKMKTKSFQKKATAKK